MCGNKRNFKVFLDYSFQVNISESCLFIGYVYAWHITFLAR